jgi:putative transposase
MARPLRICYPGAFYHITARGNERKKIFLNDRDREKFLSYLGSATERYGAAIHVYCLMGNHYHLLLETPSGNITAIMHHINGAYTTYFNIKRNRSGHLLQGRYKAILVDVDEYAEELSRYIHLNPVRAGVVAKPEEYRWSSYQDYIGQRKGEEWLHQELVLGFFDNTQLGARHNYRKFVEIAIGQKNESPWSNIMHSTFLGGQEFIAQIKEKHIGEDKSASDIPALKSLKSRPSMEQIQKEVASLIGLKPAVKKQVNLYICQRYSGKKLKEIGDHFCIGESGVSQAARRAQARIMVDKEFRNIVAEIGRKLTLSRVKN